MICYSFANEPITFILFTFIHTLLALANTSCLNLIYYQRGEALIIHVEREKRIHKISIYIYLHIMSTLRDKLIWEYGT